MKTKNFFVAKVVAVTLMLGFFSPSISVQDVAAPEEIALITELDLSQNLLSKLSTSEVTFSLFTQAEARRGRRRARGRGNRRSHRRAHRRANYRHHRRSNRRRNVLGAVAVGAVVGAAVSNNRRRYY